MRNGSFGRPGTRPIATITPPAIIGARGCRSIWPVMSRPRSAVAAGAGDDDAGRGRDQQRRDLGDQAVADRQEREGVERRRENDMPLLQHADDDAAEQVDRDDQDAGDRVALDELGGAVHRAVEVGLARDLLAALRGPRSSVIWPAFRSASIAICLPGIASRVKRAATSATRPAPFVITTNWITTRIRKTTMPTTRLPPTTNVPKAWMTLPASPCSRIRRVTLTLIASRKSVVSSSSDGNAAKSSASRHVHRRDQDHQRARDVDRDQEVEQRRRQRHDHHHDDDDDARPRRAGRCA